METEGGYRDEKTVVREGPYTSGYLKFKAIQDFTRLLKKKSKTVLTTYVLLSAVN